MRLKRAIVGNWETLGILLVVSLAFLAYAAPVIEKTLEINTTTQNQALTFLQGTDPSVRFYLEQSGRKFRGLNNYTGTFYYATALTNSAFVTVTSTNINKSKGSIQFDFDAADTNTNGTFVGVAQLKDASGNLYWYGTMDLTITKSTINTGAGALTLITPPLGANVNAAGWSITNLNAVTSTGIVSAASLKSDTIAESTAAAGVTIDSVLLKDNKVTATSVTIGTDDIISLSNRVAINKAIGSYTFDVGGDANFDSTVQIGTTLSVDTIAEKTAAAGVTIDSALIKDGEFKSVYEDLFHIYQGTQQTHVENTTFELVNWDTVVTDADSVFTDAADSITFNGTGLIHMALHYEFNNILGNKHVQCNLMKDGVEFMRFWSYVNGNSGKNIGPTGSIIFYNDSAANVWTIEIYQNDTTSETSHSGTDGKRKWWSGYRLPN